MLRLTALITIALCATFLASGQPPLNYETTPLGRIEQPLILRTYCPDPGLPPELFSHHGKGAKSPKYTPRTGRDVKGSYEPITGIPAAIAVNHGPALSYVFDTVECRLLYVWQGGFLDMFPYWGTAEQGNRRSFDYVPRLVGTVIYQASGPHPQGPGKPKFLAYELDDHGVPTFSYLLDGRTVRERITPAKEPLSFTHSVDFTSAVVQGKELSQHTGFERDLKIKVASAAAGEDVFNAYGCIACHATDGSLGHGPSLFRLAGSQRALADGSTVLADEGYLRESILDPNAKIAHGFPPNYMPPIPLKKIEVDSLVLFIESLQGE